MKDEIEQLRFRLDRLRDESPDTTWAPETRGLWLTAIGHLQLDLIEAMLPEPNETNETNEGNGSQPMRK